MLCYVLLPSVVVTLSSDSSSGKGSALLPNGARSAALSGTNHTQPNYTEDNINTCGAHDQPAVPRPKPEAHRCPSPVHLLARTVCHLFFFFFTQIVKVTNDCKCVEFEEMLDFSAYPAHQFLIFVLRGLPDSKGSLLRFIQEVHGHYLHQRPLHTPVVVHCR